MQNSFVSHLPDKDKEKTFRYLYEKYVVPLRYFAIKYINNQSIISMYDKKEYDKMLDFYEKTVTSNQDAKVRLNLDVILHRLVKNSSSEQKARAIAYAKKSMENAKPGAQGSYKALIEALSE